MASRRAAIPGKALWFWPSRSRNGLAAKRLRPERFTSTNIDRSIDSKKRAQDDYTYIDRQSDENAKSGTDDAVAGEQAVSFDNSQSTSPEHAIDMAGKPTNRYNPLEVSAANPDVSVAGTEAEYAPRGKEAFTYVGTTSAKSKKPVQIPENKSYAGYDKRRGQRPQDVAKSQNSRNVMRPGSR